jgi:acetylglutamate kinase
VESVFVGGHRRSDAETLRHVAMALRGEVNLDLVRRLNAAGQRAVGLSGVDAGMVRASRRVHRENGREEDLGQVGDVAHIDTALMEQLLAAEMLPVLAPLALGEDGLVYNVNADLFAGHLAAALKVDLYAVLTDVDGLRRDPADASTRIARLSVAESAALTGTTVKGGMIPKLESCQVALAGGVTRACILDGTNPAGLEDALAGMAEHGTELVP